MPKFIVEGIYDNQKQITSDVVVAVSEDTAEEIVTKARKAHAESSGDAWDFYSTVLVEDALKSMWAIAGLSEEKITADFVQLMTDMDMKQCEVCKKWISKDEERTCDECPEICRHCGEQYARGGDGYMGACPSCADKTDGNCFCCNRSLNDLDPSEIVEGTVKGETVKFCAKHWKNYNKENTTA